MAPHIVPTASHLLASGTRADTMFSIKEIQSHVLASGLVEACACTVASNGTLTLELRQGEYSFVVAGLERHAQEGFGERLIDEVRTALAIAMRRPAGI